MSAVDEVLTVDECAAIAKVHRKTVLRAIREGRLRASRLGQRGAYRVRRAWFDDWFDASAAPVGKKPGAVPPSAPSRRRPERGRLALTDEMGKVA